jgi:phosphate/sulfate permease
MRAVLMGTSLGVSFAHGSNDGQKGMGIIMLILFGLFPEMVRLDPATNAIPLWVKLIVAVTLGCGTMIGWKRVVKTIGERIGRQHLTYRQGAPTASACRSAPRTCCPAGWPAPCWPPIPACRAAPSATSR